jgi:hypothetical protein
MRTVAVAAALMLSNCAAPTSPNTKLVGRYADNLTARDTPNRRGGVGTRVAEYRTDGRFFVQHAWRRIP